MRLLRAFSTALRIASGTSVALPIAKPTFPFRSPTTTSALKLKRFPPFTTFATRLTRTTVSSSPLPSRSRLRYCIRNSTLLPEPRRPVRGRDHDICNRRGRRPPAKFRPPWPWRRLRFRRPSPRRRSSSTKARRRGNRRASRPRRSYGHGRHPRAPHRCDAAIAERKVAGAPGYRRAFYGAARVVGGVLALYPLLFRRLSGLAELFADPLALVADTLSFIRLGLAQTPNIRGDLSNHLFVDALNVNLVLALDCERDALGRLERDRMREPKGQVQTLARLGGAVTDAADLEALAKALADAFDHIRDQRAREPVRAAMYFCIALALDQHLTVVQTDVDDIGEQTLPELTLGSTHEDFTGLELHLDARRHRNR